MGEVYRARDTKLNRDVALKVLPEIFTADAERVARFKREAQVLASLNHPNIAAIYGLEGLEGGPLALVLELVDGPTLAEIIHGKTTAPSEGEARQAERIVPSAFKRGRESTLEAERQRSRGGPRGGGAPRGLEIDEALPIARQIAEALEAAHEQGVIHRDLKPANIKVRDDASVKVLDFGLAKMLEAGGAGADVAQGLSPAAMTNSPTLTTPAMTMAGVILGTAAYMSPEQAKGRPADKRSDIWAFGCVLYEMLTGKRAFDGEDVSDTLAAVLRGEPDWTALPANTPAQIRTLVRRCLQKDRNQRFGGMSAITFLLSEPVVAVAGPDVRRKKASWLAMSAFGLALLMAAAVAGWFLARPTRERPRAMRVMLVPPGTQPLANTLVRREVAVSPDGTRVVYVDDDRKLMIRAFDRLDAEPLRGIGDAEAPFWSADGKWVGFFSRNGEVRKVALAGGPPVTVCRLTRALSSASWGSNNQIFLGTASGLMTVPAGGGEPKVVPLSSPLPGGTVLPSGATRQPCRAVHGRLGPIGRDASGRTRFGNRACPITYSWRAPPLLRRRRIPGLRSGRHAARSAIRPSTARSAWRSGPDSRPRRVRAGFCRSGRNRRVQCVANRHAGLRRW
jgi:eukaryotic-like serine/threonine-protein kinase